MGYHFVLCYFYNGMKGSIAFEHKLDFMGADMLNKPHQTLNTYPETEYHARFGLRQNEVVGV